MRRDSTVIAIAVMIFLAFPVGAATAVKPGIGTKDNGLSKCEETYLVKYDTAQNKFGSAAVGANLVDDGTDKHEAYNLPESLVCTKAEVLDRMINPPPAPVPVEDTGYSETYSEEYVPEETTYAPSGGGGYASSSTVQCESGGDYSIDTGNGYYGAYQFDSSTWDAYGDPAYGEASEAPPAVQDAAAASVPYDAWPNC